MDGESELEMVQRHIREGARLILRQRKIVSLWGPETPEGRNGRRLLEQLEMAQELHCHHLSKLLSGGGRR